MSRSVLFTLCLLISPFLAAGWTLDPENSHLSFVSVKNAQVAEAHSFTSMEGRVSDNGKASVRIILDSVETAVDIRNERMREVLFETGLFPNATFEAQVPVDEMAKMKTGEVSEMELQGTLSVHGNSARLAVPVSITHIGDGTYQVTTVKPVIVSADQFELSAGIEKLREIAGLDSIAPSVPVSFSIRFRKDS